MANDLLVKLEWFLFMISSCILARGVCLVLHSRFLRFEDPEKPDIHLNDVGISELRSFQMSGAWLGPSSSASGDEQEKCTPTAVFSHLADFGPRNDTNEALVRKYRGYYNNNNIIINKVSDSSLRDAECRVSVTFHYII